MRGIFTVGYRDYDAALGELKLARESLPNDPQIFELTAYIQRRQGRWEESIHSLERTLELDPRNLDALHRIALRYRDLARYDEAKLALNRALAVDPNDVTTKAMRAVVELDWKADTRPLHELINELRVKDSAALQSVPDFWLTWALAERDPASASDALAVLGENALSDGPIQLSRTFVEGLNARMVKDDSKARSAFTAARVEQEKIVERSTRLRAGTVRAWLDRRRSWAEGRSVARRPASRRASSSRKRCGQWTDRGRAFCDDRGLGWRQRPGLRAACQSPFVTLVPSAMVS